MRVLILGEDGMLGHRLLREFAPRHETRVTLRQPLDTYGRFGMFNAGNAYDRVDVLDPSRVLKVFAEFKPQTAINAAGIVKQCADVRDEVLSIEVNAIFQHLLARLCSEYGGRLVHLSTDCVFSSKKGNHTEKDRPDPEDLYGFFTNSGP
jgi:dTDP-4-dehydrorhamnose reductase